MTTDSTRQFGDSSATQPRFLSLFLRRGREVYRHVSALVPNSVDTEIRKLYLRVKRDF